MPRHKESKKDGTNAETLWGAVSEQRSRDIRMGEPTIRNGIVSIAESIGYEKTDPGN